MTLGSTDDYPCATFPSTFTWSWYFYLMPSLLSSWALWQNMTISVYFLTHLDPSLIYKCQIAVRTNNQPLLQHPCSRTEGELEDLSCVLCTAERSGTWTGSRLSDDLGKEYDPPPLGLLCLLGRAGRRAHTSTLCKGWMNKGMSRTYIHGWRAHTYMIAVIFL